MAAQGILPRQDAEVHEHEGDYQADERHDGAHIPELPVFFAIDDRRDEEGHHGHELEQDVKGRAGGVLEGVADGVAHHASLALLGLLDADLLAQLLRVVPGTAGVAHHDGQHRGAADATRQHAHDHARPDEEARDERREDGVQARRDHLLHGAAGRDHDAAIGIRLHLVLLGEFALGGDLLDGLEERHALGILHLAELPAHFLDHLGGGLAHGHHGERAEEKGQHGAEQGAGEEDRVRNLEGQRGAVRGLLLEGGEQRERGEHRGANGEALAHGGGGVAEGVQGVCLRSDLGAKTGHLGEAAGVVRHRAIGVRGQGDGQRAKHAHRCEGDAVLAELAAELVANDYGDDKDNRRQDGADHTHAHALDDDRRGAGARPVLNRDRRAVIERSEELGALADGHARNKADDDATVKPPTHLLLGTEEQNDEDRRQDEED
mmetsp:Transcript_103610/g.298401  ORF Transcript_103610/g.298401 Transcript_103610/m.298401 type:complete len:434 (+) Transcript_103610:257-1558(+)